MLHTMCVYTLVVIPYTGLINFILRDLQCTVHVAWCNMHFVEYFSNLPWLPLVDWCKNPESFLHQL